MLYFAQLVHQLKINTQICEHPDVIYNLAPYLIFHSMSILSLMFNYLKKQLLKLKTNKSHNYQGNVENSIKFIYIYIFL